MIRILKKLIYKHQGSIGSWPITEPGPATHGWKNCSQKMYVFCDNRARTGNPWLEKLFTENAPFFCVTGPL